MITYIVAANSELNEDDYNKKATINDSEIMTRLGNVATAQDAQEFERLWNVRFADTPGTQGFPEGYPVFHDREDFDATWSEIAAQL